METYSNLIMNSKHKSVKGNQATLGFYLLFVNLIQSQVESLYMFAFVLFSQREITILVFPTLTIILKIKEIISLCIKRELYCNVMQCYTSVINFPTVSNNLIKCFPAFTIFGNFYFEKAEAWRQVHFWLSLSGYLYNGLISHFL